MAGDVQHPPQPGRDGSTGVVVGDHEVVVADARRAHRVRERFRRWERMAAGTVEGRAGEVDVDIERHRSRQVSLNERLADRGPRLPSHVGDHEAVGRPGLRSELAQEPLGRHDDVGELHGREGYPDRSCRGSITQERPGPRGGGLPEPGPRRRVPERHVIGFAR